MSKAIFSPIIILAAVCLVVFLVWPRAILTADLKNQVKTKQQELAERETYYSGLNSTWRELENFSGSLSAIESALPEELSLASLLNFFQSEAIASGLILKSIGQNVSGVVSLGSPEQGKQAANFQEAFFTITVQGSAESIETFLRKIELSSRIIEVESINFEAPGDEEAGLSEMSIVAKVYYY